MYDFIIHGRAARLDRDTSGLLAWGSDYRGYYSLRLSNVMWV